METPVIREEVEAFLQACQSFMGFTQYTLLTTAEHKAVADLVRKLGMGSNPPPDDAPRSHLPVDG